MKRLLRLLDDFRNPHDDDLFACMSTWALKDALKDPKTLQKHAKGTAVAISGHETVGFLGRHVRECKLPANSDLEALRACC